jgi:hypothetical protein
MRWGVWVALLVISVMTVWGCDDGFGPGDGGMVDVVDGEVSEDLDDAGDDGIGDGAPDGTADDADGDGNDFDDGSDYDDGDDDVDAEGGDAGDGDGFGDGDDGYDGGDDALDGEGDGEDGGGDDGSSGEFWPWCPDESEYVGDDWDWTLRVSPEAIYCGTFDEMRTLEQELSMKGRARVIPGDYPVPSVNGEYPFLLPVCFELLEPGSQPVLDGVGTISANHSEYVEYTAYRLNIRQPMRTAAGVPWNLELSLSGSLPAGESIITDVNGAYLDPYAFWVNFNLCQNECWALDAYRFASCHFDGANPQTVKVTFQGGWVDLHQMMGDSAASTEPAIFLWAEGQLDTASFEQHDYYKLIYNPQHHHFSRDFAVLFDSSISGACGIKVLYADPWGDDPPTRLTTIDCDLSDIEERIVIDTTFEW